MFLTLLFAQLSSGESCYFPYVFCTTINQKINFLSPLPLENHAIIKPVHAVVDKYRFVVSLSIGGKENWDLILGFRLSRDFTIWLVCQFIDVACGDGLSNFLAPFDLGLNQQIIEGTKNLGMALGCLQFSSAGPFYAYCFSLGTSYINFMFFLRVVNLSFYTWN